MANIDSAHGFIVETSFDSGSGIPTWKGDVGAGQVFVVGDPLLASNGYIYIAAAASPIVGVAAQNCTSLTAGTDVKFVPALPNIVFSAQTSGPMSQGNIYSLCDIEGTTGIFEVNEDSNTYGTVRIVGKKDVGNTSLGTWCEVLVVFQRTKLGTFYYTTPAV